MNNRSMKQSHKTHNGTTVIEMLVVILIFSVMMAIGTSLFLERYLADLSHQRMPCQYDDGGKYRSRIQGEEC